MAKNWKKIVQIAGMATLLGATVAANIVLSNYAEIINIYFNGFGADFSNFDSSAGNNICQEIEREGIVLLKNEESALPLTQKNEKGKISQKKYNHSWFEPYDL